MIRWMRKEALMASAAVVLSSLVGHAHPDHGGKDVHPHEHADTAGPSEKQKEKRLERVVRRAEARERNREQRTKDERRNLRTRVGRHLRGADLTPPLVAALKAHAERTATLRQIRYIAAKEKDYDTVVKADKVLAKVNSTHERWWRTELRKARKK